MSSFAPPSLPVLFAQRVVIGVGDLAVSNNTSVTLTTYALGSCVGLVAYDPATRAGGMLHVMLPDSSIAQAKANDRPAMFADTALPMFFRELAGVKADRARLRLHLSGGACVLSGPDTFKIGERNAAAVKSWLAAQGLRLFGTDLGGTVNRTLHLELATGRLSIKMPTGTDALMLA